MWAAAVGVLRIQVRLCSLQEILTERTMLERLIGDIDPNAVKVSRCRQPTIAIQHEWLDRSD